VLIGCCFLEAGSLGGVFDAAGVFFVPVCNDLGFARSEIASYLIFYALGSVVAMPFVGKWLPKYNINILLTVMMLAVLIAYGAMGLYNHIWQWWISGAVFGVCGAFIFVMPAPVLINNWFKKRRGLALGIGMSFSGIGGAILSPAFAAIIEAVGTLPGVDAISSWRYGYFIAAGIIAVLVLPWTLFVFKFKPADKGLKPYGWTEADERLSEEIKRTKKAIPGVSARKAIWTIPFICMFVFAGFVPFCGALNAHLPAHGIAVGLNPVVAATIVSAVMVGNVTEKILVGFLNDKVGIHFTVNLQLVMVVLGFIGFLIAGNNLMLIYISAFLFGAQNSLISVSVPLIIRQLFGNKDYVKILAYARIGNGVFGAIWPPLIGLFFDKFHTYGPAFMFGIAIMLASFTVVTIAYGRRKKLKWEDLPDDQEEANKLRMSRLASTL